MRLFLIRYIEIEKSIPHLFIKGESGAGGEREREKIEKLNLEKKK